MATEPLHRNDEELVEVFGTREESEAQIVCGLLETAGIDAMVLPLEAPQDVLPGVGPIVVRVPASQADEARDVIAAYRDNPDNDLDFSGDDTPPAA
ncbi:MAG TPA: DUF2007 domain-containing protein [Terriglobales bacterium]|nr:DUF2007 domain-containing protein [Terriglobales bacterium]